MAYTAFCTIGLVFVPLVAEAVDNSGAMIGTWTLVVAIVTGFLVAVQIYIALRQTRLAEEQLEIARRQTSILENQDAILKRTEDLSLRGAITMYAWDGGPELYDLSLNVMNLGKGVQGVYVEIYLEEHDTELSLAVPPGSPWIQGESEYFFRAGQGDNFNLTRDTRYYDVLLPGDGQETTLPPMTVLLTREGHYYIRWNFNRRTEHFPKIATTALRSFQYSTSRRRRGDDHAKELLASRKAICSPCKSDVAIVGPWAPTEIPAKVIKCSSLTRSDTRFVRSSAL